MQKFLILFTILTSFSALSSDLSCEGPAWAKNSCLVSYKCIFKTGPNHGKPYISNDPTDQGYLVYDVDGGLQMKLRNMRTNQVRSVFESTGGSSGQATPATIQAEVQESRKFSEESCREKGIELLKDYGC